MADPYFGNVALRLPLFGPNNGTAFADYSPAPKTITRYGDAKTVTAQSKYYGSSGYFDGTGDYLLASAGPIGSGDFTLEAWIRTNTVASGYAVIFHLGSGVAALYRKANLILWYQGGDRCASSPITANTWAHVAVVRNSGVISVFVDGVKSSTDYSSSTNYSNTNIGIASLTGTAENYAGYLQDVRFTVGIARYTADFTPPAQLIDLDVDTVSLLLPMFGADQGTSFTDYSPSPKTITRYGDAKTLTAQYKYYGSSGYFDGTGDYLAASDVGLNLGSGDFTIECWLRVSSFADVGGLFFVGDPASNDNRIQVDIKTTQVLTFFAASSSGSWGIDSSAINAGTWYHVVAQRNGSTVSLWIDGVQKSTGIVATEPSAGQNWRIGFARNGGLARQLNGHVQDLRITKGVARYTADFTPPEQLIDLDVDTVSLLLPMSGEDGGTEFLDRSPFPKAITRYGDAKTVTARSKYYGSSGYFDGNGDYLGVAGGASLAFGTGDFTVELWVLKTTAVLPYETLVDTRSTGGYGATFFLQFDNGVLKFYANNGYRITATTAVSIGSWMHVALVRASGSTKLYINGVQEGVTFNDTTNYVCGADRPALGASGNSPGAYTLSGYLQDLRITKGIARYTADFTPPNKFIRPPFIYLLSGVVKDKANDPAARTVLLYREDTNELVTSVISDEATGEFAIGDLDPITYRLVFTGEPDRTDLALSGLIPAAVEP